MNFITHTFVGLKCLTETKIQILCDHVDHTRFHIVEMGCQMVQRLSADIVGPTMFVNLTPALVFIPFVLLGGGGGVGGGTDYSFCIVWL